LEQEALDGTLWKLALEESMDLYETDRQTERQTAE
jgi:hypothetical protein